MLVVSFLLLQLNKVDVGHWLDSVDMDGPPFYDPKRNRQDCRKWDAPADCPDDIGDSSIPRSDLSLGVHERSVRQLLRYKQICKEVGLPCPEDELAGFDYTDSTTVGALEPKDAGFVGRVFARFRKLLKWDEV
jgi:hypothetical protein